MRTSGLIRGVFLIALAAGCSSSSGGGATGGTSGTGGTGGGGGSPGNADSAAPAADAAIPGFMSVLPCTAATDYKTGSTVTFPITVGAGFRYDPQCLTVKAGSTVTFNGDFSMHPLNPSKNRPNADNPITTTDTGASKSFTFSRAGFYAYYCQFHDPADTGTLMSGVIWVTP
jgi:plastocyanin